MTPGINQLKKAKLPFELHQYQHDPKAESYGEEAAQKLGAPAHSIFKTLVIELDNQSLAVCVLPVTTSLNLKQAARAFKAKKAKMADTTRVEKTTGYVLGGVCPLGQKKRLPTAIDKSAESIEQVYISGGRRGLEIQLSPQDLARLTQAKFMPLGE